MLDSVANFIKVQALQGYDSSATTIDLKHNQGALLPSGNFNLVWWNSTDYPDPSDDPFVEIVRKTGITGDQLTITRGQENTTPSAKNIANKTYTLILAITAKMITDIGASLAKPWNVVAVSGTIDGVNAVFTVSPTPTDSNSMQLSLARQPQIQGVDYTLSGSTITYVFPPDISLADQPHYAQFQ